MPTKSRLIRPIATSATKAKSQPADPLVREDDIRLIQAIGQGEERALERFYDRYSSLVFSVCMRVLRNSADAEEAVIDIFWEIWEKPARYDPKRGSVLSYLVLLAKSRAIDRQRSRHSHQKLSLDGSAATGDDRRRQPVAASTPEPIDDIWLSERQAQVRESLQRLTPAQRQAVELSFFHGLSHRQIADRLNEPLGTIKTRIRQGIIQMRDGLRSVRGGGSL